jgi:hypothetical protein
MGERCGYIPAAVGGKKVALSPTGFIFEPTPANMARWRGWWRVVRADQWGIFFAGGVLGMVLPALLYVEILPAGSDIRGLAIAAELAFGIGARAGALMAGAIAFIAAWVLLKTQLDLLEGMVRAITDILWAGSRRVRTWRGGDVRAVYYLVLAAAVIWGVIALRLAQPIILLQIGANVASVVFVFASWHLLYLNTRLLPEPLRPPMWRRAMLVPSPEWSICNLPGQKTFANPSLTAAKSREGNRSLMPSKTAKATTAFSCWCAPARDNSNRVAFGIRVEPEGGVTEIRCTRPDLDMLRPLFSGWYLQSRPTRVSGASRSPAILSIFACASGAWGARTTGTWCFTIPAFSPEISARVSPKR